MADGTDGGVPPGGPYAVGDGALRRSAGQELTSGSEVARLAPSGPATRPTAGTVAAAPTDFPPLAIIRATTSTRPWSRSPVGRGARQAPHHNNYCQLAWEIDRSRRTPGNDCQVQRDRTDEYESSAEYLHLLSRSMWSGLGPRLAATLAVVDAAGPVVELGAGSGLGTDVILDSTSGEVLAVEPSPALRGVLLARLADRGETRVRVLPHRAQDAPLPERMAAVVGVHMVGHLPPDDRAALWTRLADRLVPGGPVVLNVQPPDSAVAVPPFPWSGVTVGGVHYEGTGRADPEGEGRVRWRMDYRTRDGERVLATASAEYDWHLVSADGLAAELAAAGLDPVVDDDLVIARTARRR